MLNNRFKIGRGFAAIGAAAILFASGVGSASAAPDNIDPDALGSISLHKFSGAPVVGLPNDGTETAVAGRTPLAGVGFTLYRVNGLDVTDPADWNEINDLNDWFVTQGTSGHWSAGATVGSGAGYTFSTVGTEQVTAAGTGLATWGTPATTSSLPLGVYFVQETSAPAAVSEHTLPFLVTIPLAHNATSSWLYDVHAYPKNALVDLSKAAVDAGTVGVGSNIAWNVTNTVPTIQNAFEDYRLRDVLDSRLSYVADSSTVTLDGVALLATDFSVVPTGQTLELTFTPDGRVKLDAAQGDDIVWSFSTSVNSIGDGTIENVADVMVNKPSGVWGTDSIPSNEVTSNWGSVRINKHEAANSANLLSGASFQIFGTEADAIACNNAVIAADGVLNSVCANAISVTRDAAGATIPAQSVFTTDTDGAVTIPGLHVGINGDTTQSYWVVETVPPAGYVNAETVRPVTVAASTLATGVLLEVPNAQTPPTELPRTGGASNAMLLIGAIALAAGSTAMLIVNKKKKK